MEVIPCAAPLHALPLYAFGLLLLVPTSFFFTAAKFLLLIGRGVVGPRAQLLGRTLEINCVSQPDEINQVATFRIAPEAIETTINMHIEGLLRFAGVKGTPGLGTCPASPVWSAQVAKFPAVEGHGGRKQFATE